MGQKINPVSLRLQTTNRHFDNCWYSNYFYRHLINKDIFLERYLNNFLKLLKLPTGRYSIHHLQKKTQVYNFFCYSKSTRLWRSKLFGLNKNKKNIKKTRYFLQNKTKLKNRINVTKIKHKQIDKNYYYNTINLQGIHKIQRRITSFQNLQLWSALQQTKFKKNSINKLTNFSKYLSLKSLLSSNSLLFNQTNLNQHQLFLEQHKNQSLTQVNRDKNLLIKKSLIKQKVPDYLAKINNYSSPFSNKLQKNIKKQNILLQMVPNLINLENNLSFFNKLSTETNFTFLHNLFIYKILKSQLNKKENSSKKKQFGLVPIANFREITNCKINKNPERFQVVFHTHNCKYNNYLESFLASFYKLDLDLIPFKVKNDWQHASYLAQEIVYFLEKRIPFRRLKGKLLKQLSQIESIRGVRITCSGRVGGKSKKAQRSKTECLKYGQTSLQVFSSKIDFSLKTAFTSFGSVGVKVWICYK